MKKLAKILLVLVILGIFLYPKPHNKVQKSVVRTPATWGAYTGNSDKTMSDFESIVGSTMDIHAIFWGWDSDFPESLAGALGKQLLIFWDPQFGYDPINSGSQDAYIAEFAQSARAYEHPIILVPFSEFNLNEAPWGNGVGTNTPAKFISAWRRVHDIFKANGADNVKFGLAYNNISIPFATYAEFYPGDAYVDYVGLDGFNMDNKSFAQTFERPLYYAGLLGKPLWIFSTGSVRPQGQFIHDLGQTGLPWIWFNQSPYDLDANALPVFKSIL